MDFFSKFFLECIHLNKCIVIHHRNIVFENRFPGLMDFRIPACNLSSQIKIVNQTEVYLREDRCL